MGKFVRNGFYSAVGYPVAERLFSGSARSRARLLVWDTDHLV
jgi:hypothetical protein